MGTGSLLVTLASVVLTGNVAVIDKFPVLEPVLYLEVHTGYVLRTEGRPEPETHSMVQLELE